MPISSPLSPDKVHRYTHGVCYELADAIHRLTGWEVVGIVERIPAHRSTDNLAIRHALIRLPNGLLIDSTGIFSEEEFEVANVEKMQKRSDNIKNLKKLHDELLNDKALIQECPEISEIMVPAFTNYGEEIRPIALWNLERYRRFREPRNIENLGPDYRDEAIHDALILIEWAHQATELTATSYAHVTTRAVQEVP